MLSVLTRGVLCSADALVRVSSEVASGTVVSALRLLSKRVLPAEVSTAREAVAVGKSLSRL